MPFNGFSTNKTPVWEIHQEGIINPIGIDMDNNILLYCSEDDVDQSNTRFVKYSNYSTIILDKTVNINYDYLRWARRRIDSQGNLYIIGIAGGDIYIEVFDNELDFVKNITIDTKEEFPSITPSDIFITEIGNVFLRYTDKYNILNATHAERINGLYRIDEEGEIKWHLSLKEIIKMEAEFLFNLSEIQEDLLFVSLSNVLYKINSNRGKVKWEREFLQDITCIASILNDVCVVTVDSVQFSFIELNYLSYENELKWERTFESFVGRLSVEKIESKLNQIGIYIVNFGEEGILGETNETFVVLDHQGETLIEENFYCSSYFIYKKNFFMTSINSYYTHHQNITDNSMHLLLYKYDAPPFIPTNGVDSDFFHILPTTLIVAVIYILKLRKRNKKLLNFC